MAKKVQPRDVSPFLKGVRDILLGRDLKNNLRFADNLAPRTQPHPNLPDGPCNKLNRNFYCKRDGRRLSVPPTVIMEWVNPKKIPPGTPEAEAKKIAAGSVKAVTSGLKKLPTPGESYQWTLKK